MYGNSAFTLQLLSLGMKEVGSSVDNREAFPLSMELTALENGGY